MQYPRYQNIKDLRQQKDAELTHGTIWGYLWLSSSEASEKACICKLFQSNISGISFGSRTAEWCRLFGFLLLSGISYAPCMSIPYVVQ